MLDSNEREQELARAMLQSKLKYPSSDLESIVMSRIKHASSERSILKNKRLSFLFLAIEIVLGIFINLTLNRFSADVPEIHPLTLINCFQIGFVLIFFIQLDYCISLTVLKQRPGSTAKNKYQVRD